MSAKKAANPLLVGFHNPYGAERQFALYPLPAGATGHNIWKSINLVRPEFSKSSYVHSFDRVCGLLSRIIKRWQG